MCYSISHRSVMTDPRRDLIGYGRDVPLIEWPDGACVAVSLVLNYEEGSERTFPRDGRNEGLGEIARDVGRHRDLATESVYEYGSRAGVHRLLRLFDRYELKCTVFAAALALEHNSEVASWLGQAGHEACAHGLRWSEDWLVSREEEAERIRLAVESIERACGERPVGWYNRWMPSVHTRELLVEHGGFLYDSNAYNDDLPYYVEVQGRPHLVIPYTLTYNDVRFVNGTLGGPSDFYDYCRRALDYLSEEGQERPRMLSIGLHSRWTGQAGRTSALRDFLEHALDKRGVWFARRRDIADLWLKQYPPP
jgi:peptidoglycan/xylan/chitin deacetylase (PgdA/CDA1 family)